jgi:hypothetical protein
MILERIKYDWIDYTIYTQSALIPIQATLKIEWTLKMFCPNQKTQLFRLLDA